METDLYYYVLDACNYDKDDVAYCLNAMMEKYLKDVENGEFDNYPKRED